MIRFPNLTARSFRLLTGMCGAAVMVLVIAGCGGEGDGGFPAAGGNASTRPTSCSITRNNFGHPLTCQCASSMSYDERHGVCSSSK